MTKDHQNKLESNRVALIEYIDPDVIIDHLRGQLVLTFRQADEIKQARGTNAKVGDLLDVLMRKDDSTFGKLVKALRENDKGFLADRLES